jgi:hypothetical protein
MVTSKFPKLPTKIHIPGGCASVTVNSMVHRIKSNIEDQHKMGQWTGVKYRIGKEKRTEYYYRLQGG